jgi:hypothetical protein
MRKRRISATVIILVGALTIAWPSRPAHAWAFVDYSALAQRAAQFIRAIAQFRQLVRAGRDSLAAFKSAYEGLKDWKQMGWVDTLELVNMPWFDGVEGIDEIRNVTTLTVMSADQSMALWSDVKGLANWKTSPRYQKDPWYKKRVDALMRQSKRAKAQRAALLRQMQRQNKQLIDDVKKIKSAREAMADEHRLAGLQRRPVNTAKVSALQSEIAAIEAKYQGENLVLRNQQAIMFLVGDDEAQRFYEDTLERGWIQQNRTGMRDIGRGFAK